MHATKTMKYLGSTVFLKRHAGSNQLHKKYQYFHSELFLSALQILYFLLTFTFP